MELPNVLGKLKSESEPPRLFLALVLTEEMVQAAAWQVVEGKTELASLGTPVAWDGDESATNTLVQAVDATISASLEGLPQEPSEIVYGLPPSWTNEAGILENKLKLIKFISYELELKPLGFVVVTDSLLRYLKMQEGTPSTSIMIQLSRDELTLFLIRLGRIENTQVVGRSDDLVTDVEEGISRFPAIDNLPSRIIVFDGMHNLDEAVQHLLSYDWQSKFNFLHIPKVESLPKDILIRSVSLAGGSEIARSLGIFVSQDPATPLKTSPLPKQLPDQPPKQAPTEEEVANVTPLASAAELGFAPSPPNPTTPPPPSPTPPPPMKNPPPSKPDSTPPKPRSKKPAFKFPSFSLKPRLPQLSSSSFSHKWLLPIIAIFVLISLLGAAVWFVPHAHVTLLIQPRLLEETLALTLSPDATVMDQETNTIPAELLEISVTDSASLPTSGSILVGEQASGEVTIYNRTSLEKTFPAGTVLLADSLEFTTDQEVTVAGSTAGEDYVDIPGKEVVSVTASAIGSSSNLPSNTEFIVDDYSQSTYIAKSNNEFTGGSSQEIQAVAKKDQEDLRDTLTNSLSSQAQDKLLSSSKPGYGVYLLDSTFEITEESYSAEVQEQAPTLEATFTASVKAVRYSNLAIEQLVSSAIDSSIPSGYHRTSDLPSVELSSVSSEDNNLVEAEAKVAISLLPELNAQSLRQSLRGLSSAEIEPALTNITGLTSAHVELTPHFIPPRLKSMPRNPNNITISIQSAQ